MKKHKLNEDLFIDVPEVEYELDTNIDLEGPQPGNDVGVSAMLLDLIGDIAKTISNYNQLQADLEDYPEIAEVIKDFADDENVKLGKVQSALKTISPNAEYIMNGAVEAEEEMDPGSPLDESLNEDVTDIPSSTMFKMNPDKFAQFCRQEGWLQNMSRDEWQYLQYDIAHEGRKLFALANDIKACGTHRNLSTQEIAETLFDMMQDENNDMVESLKRKLRKKFKETLDSGKIDSREDDILDKVFAYLRQEKGDEEFVEFAKKTLGLTDSELKTFCGLCEGYMKPVNFIIWYILDGEEDYMIISALNKDDAVDKFSINLDPSLITDVHEVKDHDYHTESLKEDYEELDFVTQARFDIFHDGDYDLNKLRNDLESLLQDGLDPIEFLGIDAEGLDDQSSYSYSTMGEVDPNNVSSISFDFGNDGSYDYSFIEDCIAKAVANQNLNWGEYVDYEDVTYAYPEYNNLSEAHHTSTTKRFSKRKQKEIFEFIDDLGGYGDYDDKVESVMDEFDLSQDDAEDIVWEWSINQEDSDLDESLIESFDSKQYNQALDDYMSSKNISVEKLFGALNYDDPRYIQLFNSLKDLGYKPQETGTYSRGYFVPAMTITVATREVPEDVVDLIHDLGGVTGRHIGFHKGKNNWKLKFELRDDDFSSFEDTLLQSLDESLNEAKRNLKPLVSVFGDDPEDFSLHVLSRDIVVDGLFNPYTWDDGAPILKYFERDKHPKQVSDASLKKGRQFIYDRYHWKAYFPYHGGWLCVDGDDLGWDRPDDEDDEEEGSLKFINEGVDRIKIPAPYDKRFMISQYEDEFADYQPGDKIDGYDCHFLAYLEPIDDNDEVYPILTDDSDYPVCELVGERLIPVDLEDSGLYESLKEDTIKQNGEWVDNDDEESSNWLKVISKPVPDSDGFLTDYTMYRDLDDPEHYVFVFGDNEIYSPDDENWDYEAFSNEEATEWYNNYEGFTDDEEDDTADDDFEDSSSEDDLNESLDLDIGTYGFVSKQAFKEFKKLSKLLVKEQNHYDEVLDSLESNANTDEEKDSLMADNYYQKLIKVYQDTYNIINELSKAFDNGSIYIEDNPRDDRILIDQTLYSVEDLSKLLNHMQDSIK